MTLLDFTNNANRDLHFLFIYFSIIHYFWYSNAVMTLNDWLTDTNDDINHEIIEIDKVLGAFLIKKLLSKEECNIAANNVQNIISQDPKANNSKIDDDNKKNTIKSIQRRNSQHHTPYHVHINDMTKLCSRIRKYLILNGVNKAGPNNNSELNDIGLELSTFLRLYDYHEGDYSTPHYDKSYTNHSATGALMTFSAYSVLIYLSNEEEYDGGETGFFIFTEEEKSKLKRSNKGNTLFNFSSSGSSSGSSGRSSEKESEYEQILVKGCQGDVLLFPHGLHQGCYPDPYHQGCLVTKGNKTLIRTDVIFKTKNKNKNNHNKLNRKNKNESRSKSTQVKDNGVGDH